MMYGAAAAVTLVSVFVMIAYTARRGPREIEQARAGTMIDNQMPRFDSLTALARHAQRDRDQYKHERDSLIAARPVLRVHPTRQRTSSPLAGAILSGARDTLDAARAITTLRAERDTAIVDRDLARDDAHVLRAQLLRSDSLISVQMLADSTRWAHATAITDSVRTDLRVVRALVVPRWHVRFGRGLKRAATTVAIVAVAIVIDRQVAR